MSTRVKLFSFYPARISRYYPTSGFLTGSGISASAVGRYIADFNPRTWVFNTTLGATWNVGIDSQIAGQTVDGLAFYIQNASQLFATSRSIAVLYSDDGVNFNFDSGRTFTPVDPDISQIQVIDFQESTYGVDWTNYRNRQYYALLFSGGSGATELERLSILAPVRRHYIGRAFQRPDNQARRFYNQEVSLAGGQSYITGVRSGQVKAFRRRFFLDAQTDIDAVEDAFRLSNGRLRPLVLDEDASYKKYRLVRFSSDELVLGGRGASLWEPTFELEEVPQIPEGEVY